MVESSMTQRTLASESVLREKLSYKNDGHVEFLLNPQPRAGLVVQ